MAVETVLIPRQYEERRIVGAGDGLTIYMKTGTCHFLALYWYGQKVPKAHPADTKVGILPCITKCIVHTFVFSQICMVLSQWRGDHEPGDERQVEYRFLLQERCNCNLQPPMNILRFLYDVICETNWLMTTWFCHFNHMKRRPLSKLNNKFRLCSSHGSHWKVTSRTSSLSSHQNDTNIC